MMHTNRLERYALDKCEAALSGWVHITRTTMHVCADGTHCSFCVDTMLVINTASDFVLHPVVNKV